MGKKDYESVVERMRLANGLPWTIPITLSATKAQAGELKVGDDIELTSPPSPPLLNKERGQGGEILAVLHLEEKYEYNPKNEATKVYKTTEDAHPGVRWLYEQGPIYLAGKVRLLKPIRHPDFQSERLRPTETRSFFKRRGWRTVVAFQTRNPIHRAHEFLTKLALEVTDGLLIHPIVGETQPGDIPADVRMQCYRALIENYYPKNRVLLSVNPAFMRYAGPREAIFHAIIRKNYGCTHFIVGRDHAGVGNYYGPFDAHRIFEEFKPGELGITPLFFDNAFFCRRCGEMVSNKTCPHPESDRLILSGTKVREMLARGEIPPSEFTRPEVAKILIESMKRS